MIGGGYSTLRVWCPSLQWLTVKESYRHGGSMVVLPVYPWAGPDAARGRQSWRPMVNRPKMSPNHPRFGALYLKNHCAQRKCRLEKQRKTRSMIGFPSMLLYVCILQEYTGKPLSTRSWALFYTKGHCCDNSLTKVISVAVATYYGGPY